MKAIQKTSRSGKIALMILGIVDAVQAIFIRNAYRSRAGNKTVLQLSAQVTASVEAARRLWPGNLSQREVDIMKARLKRYLEKHLPVGTAMEAPVITSIALDLLEDLYSHVKKNSAKAGPVIGCISKVRQLHRYFDRRLDKFECYDAAKKRADAFYQEAELWA